MKSRSPLLMIMSFLLALLLAVSVYVYLNTLSNQSDKIPQYDMIVAGVEIPQYTKITKEMVTSVKVLQLPPDSGTYYSNAADVVGKYAGERILQGEQFFKSRVLESAAGNLSLTLKGNNRAVAVMANLESGVAKLIKTGDYIDVLVSLPEIKDQDKVIRPDISKIILQKILVLAIDQTTTSTSSTEGSTAAKNDGNKAVEDIFYLTLSVPVPELEKLALAENIGRLKFALRPKGDNSIQPTDGAIWEELLARAADTQKSPATATPTTPAAKPATVETQKPAETKKPAVSTTKPSTTTTKTQYVYYVVKAGDTLMNIARTQMNDASQYKLLQKINNIADPNHIRPGTRIKIPVTK